MTLGREISMEYTLTARDAALKNIGRTLVNFQRLEAHVKALATLQPFSGSLQKVQHDQARHVEKVLGLTLGQAINVWMETFQGSRPVQPLAADMFDIALRHRYEFNWDAETKDRHAKELRELLEFRNELVHGKRLRIDWGTSAECEALSAELEAWIKRIGAQMEFLAAIIQGFNSVKPEDVEVVEGEE